jgi:hypothetical protein
VNIGSVLISFGINWYSVSVSSSDYGTHKIDEKLHTLLSKVGLFKYSSLHNRIEKY